MKMPALFVGHGSPMNAIEDNDFTAGFHDVARALPRPQAVLCISAHWETSGVYVTGAEHPEIIHDFHGFSPELFAVQYPAPGDPALARRVACLLDAVVDDLRGLDHGAWSVLRNMYPDTRVPVVQLSLDHTADPAEHFELARKLAPLRDEGVLILASGDIVHNLSLVHWTNPGPADWADRFNQAVKQAVLDRDTVRLIDYHSFGPDARLAVPTKEHYLPLLYLLAVISPGEPVAFFNDRTVMNSISMTSVKVGKTP